LPFWLYSAVKIHDTIALIWSDFFTGEVGSMSLSIRQNPMHLSLFLAFCGIRSRVHAGQKDVYLLE